MTATKKKSARKKAASKPWKHAAPKGSSHKTLSPSQKRSAKAAAKKGGRRYPNLVDNMRAAAKKKKKAR
jgi:hypothetical protein